MTDLFRPNTEAGPPPVSGPVYAWLRDNWQLVWSVWFTKQAPLIDALDDATKDPYPQYVRVAPGTAARNAIVPNDDFAGLTLYGFSGGDQNILDVYNFSGLLHAWIDANCKITAYGFDAGGQKITGGAAATAATEVPIYSQLTGERTLKYANTSVPGGNTVAGTGTETAFASTYTFAANSLVAGSLIRVSLWGVYGATALLPTLRMKIKLDSVVVFDTGAQTIPVALTNSGWSAQCDIVVNSIGAGGAVEAQGYAELATAATTSLSINVANTAAISLDTTSDRVLSVTVQWGTSSATNTITVRQMPIELMKVAA